MSNIDNVINSSIHKYGDKYRVAYSYISAETGKRVRTCKRGFNFQREAKAWATNELPKIIKQLEKVETLDENLTMDELIEEYMEHFKLWNRDTSYDTKENIVRTKIIPFFTGKKVYDIKNNDIRQWQDFLKKQKTRYGKPYAETYLRTISNQLSAIFAYAVDYHNLPCNPILNVKRIGKKKAPVTEFWRFDEYQKFIKSIQDDPMGYYAFQVLFWCGIREGELLALQRKNVDIENRVINIEHSFHRRKKKNILGETKTPKSERTVIIPQFLADELKEYFDSIYGLEDDTRIFPMLKNNLYTIRDRGCAISGVKRITVHGLRHSHASFLKRILKIDLEEIAERIGHASTEMTELYTHEYGDEGIEIANKIDTFMGVVNNVSKK